MSRRLVGVIADTHGLLRPEALEALRGCSQIIHAGDIGKPEVLATLQELAPTLAVRGNVDRGDWARTLPITATVVISDVRLYVLHDEHDLGAAAVPRGTRVIVSGHSHRPRVEEIDGVLRLNPGAAGPRRFRLPVTLALLEIDPGGRVKARVVDLAV